MNRAPALDPVDHGRGLELAIPKLRSGSFVPSLLERRRRIDRAPFAVVMEAYVTGTSVRKAEDRSANAATWASGSAQIHGTSEFPDACAAFPCVFLDATYCKARIGGGKGGKGSRVTSQAVVVATGASTDGRREVLGFAVGDGEDGAFRTAFCRSLKARGLHGTELVISDAHVGLKSAISAVMVGPHGSVVASISCRTSSRKCPRPRRRWSLRRSA